MLDQNSVPAGTISNADPMGSVNFIASGEFVDPRVTMIGTVVDVIDLTTNVYGKAQRSVRIETEDDKSVLVSGFGAKASKLEGVKLGFKYLFRGRLKIKLTTFMGKEQESYFLNL